MSEKNKLKFNELPQLQLKWDQLLLDPNNPRLHSLATKPYETNGPKGLEIVKNLQDDLLIQMNDKRFDISELTDSLKENGFISVGIPTILVKKLEDNHYLTLEGNRRVTAITKLMNSEQNTLDPEIIKSFNEITVTDCSMLSDDEIEHYLGMIHIGGTKEWQLLPKSKYLFSQFIRELCLENALTINDKRFEESFITNNLHPLLDTKGEKVLKRVAQANTCKLSVVRNSCAIYRMFIQVNNYLENIGSTKIGVDQASLLGDTYKSPKLRQLFQVNQQNLIFTEEGLQKWTDACCDTKLNEDKGGRVITAAAAGESSLRQLASVFEKDEDPDKPYIARILDERIAAQKVLTDLESLLNERTFLRTLEQVWKLLGTTNLTELSEEWGNSEKSLFKKIKIKFEQIESAGRTKNE